MSQTAQLRAILDYMIRYVGSPAEPTRLEWLAMKWGFLLNDAGAPRSLRGHAVRALKSREDAHGATILAAMARLCPGTASDLASSAVQELERERGLRAELPPGLGKLRLGNAYRFRWRNNDAYLYLLERDGEEQVGMAFVFVGRVQRLTGVLRDGLRTWPVSRAAADEEVRKRIRAEGAGSISRSVLAGAVEQACAGTNQLERQMTFELSFALTPLALILGMDPLALPPTATTMSSA